MTFRICLLWTALAMVFVTGCQSQKSGRSQDEHKGDEVVVSYNDKFGLSIPPQTAIYIGLKIAEVNEHNTGAEIKFMAQIYSAAIEEATALASGVVGSAEAASLRVNLPASVEWNGIKMTARIKELNRQLEKASGQVEVLIAVDDAGKALSQSAFVPVFVPVTGTESGVVTVPRTALLRTVEGDFVYTVSGERFIRASVKPGLVNDKFVEITDGLYAGDQIVVEPVMTLWLTELQFIRGGKSCADGH